MTTVDSTSKEENDGGEEGSCGLENLHAAVESTDVSVLVGCGDAGRRDDRELADNTPTWQGRWTEAKVVDLDAAARIARLVLIERCVHTTCYRSAVTMLLALSPPVTAADLP